MARLVIGTDKTIGVPGYYKVSTEPIPTGRYQLYDRVYTDTGVQIGTVCGFFTGSHDGSTNYREFAVVCLDAVYRNLDKKWQNSASKINALPLWTDITVLDTDIFRATATAYTDIIVNNNSPAASFCRSLSFSVDGVTYYGQIPNLIELNMMFEHGSMLDSLDGSITSSTLYSYYIQGGKYWGSGGDVWSCVQTGTGTTAAYISSNTGVRSSTGLKHYGNFTFPILEIPNEL